MVFSQPRAPPSAASMASSNTLADQSEVSRAARRPIRAHLSTLSGTELDWARWRCSRHSRQSGSPEAHSCWVP